jgi:hypothetical protein
MFNRLVMVLFVLSLALASTVQAADIVLVNEAYDTDVDGVQDDQGLIDFLVAEGHNVDVQPGIWMDLDPDEIALLDAADLVIVSRSTNSGNYADGEEPTQWNSVTTPLIQMSAYLVRSSRWKWMDTGSATNNSGSPAMEVLDLNHPIFTGVVLDANNVVEAVDAGVGAGETSFAGTLDAGNGTLLAKAVAEAELAWIAEWEAGVEFYEGAGQIPAAKRMMFCGGTQEVGATPQGAWNFTGVGAQVFRNAINYMLGGRRIVLVTEEADADADGAWDDQNLANWLVGQGHFVDVQRGTLMELDADEIDLLNAADLVIVSRSTNSGNYDDGDEPTQWNAVTAPLIQMSAYLVRSSRWKWMNSGSATNNSGSPAMEVLDLNHPIFADVVLDANNVVEAVDASVGAGETSFVGTLDAGNGMLLAKAVAEAELAWIAEWAPGVEFYDGSGQMPSGYRLLFCGGTQEVGATPQGALNLTAEGETMFVNAIAYMLGKGVPYTYTYEGDAAAAGDAEALDGTWNHDNGSDAWDGTGMGDGAPGGAAALVEDDVTFLRIQDIGDPRGLGFSDPSNRKIYLTRQVESNLDGTQIEFRICLATTGPLDGLGPDEPWPAEGIAYHVRDGGKGMIGVGEAGLGVISFSLARGGQPGLEDVTGDVLVMNNLVGDVPSGDVDTEDVADTIVAKNWIAVDDITQWNTFAVEIAAGGTGTHVVTVSVNGGPTQAFDVTAGTDTEGESSYLAMGSSGTGGITAFDVDYLAFKPGVIPEPEPEPEPEPVTR